MAHSRRTSGDCEQNEFAHTSTYDVYKAIFKAELEKEEAIQRLPKWEPPKASMYECITDIIDLVKNEFTELKFKEGLRLSFLNTGTMYDENKQLVTYFHKSGSGSMPIDAESLENSNVVTLKGKFNIREDDLMIDLLELNDGGEDSDTDEL